MRALALTLSFLLGLALFTGATPNSTTGDIKINKKQLSLKRSLNKEVNKHLFYPQNKTVLNGTADVMLQVYPDGDIRIVYIKATDENIKAFVESQVKKMKVDKESVIIGEVFRYRFNFKPAI